MVDPYNLIPSVLGVRSMLHKITIKGNNSDHISRLPKVYVEFFNLAPLKSRFCGPKALKLKIGTC